MAMKKLPLGIENFEEIRTEDFYYIDKSMLIADLLNGWGKVNLFTRPRRFGKTLNMSMLKSFFEIGTNPQLFDGLAISKETKLLCHYHIDTAEQLFSLKDRLQKQMEQCVEERKHLRYKIRANRPEEEIQELKEQIKGLTEEIGTLRKEVVLCDGIAARSKVIEEKFKMVREEKEKKEEQSHEHIRRSR